MKRWLLLPLLAMSAGCATPDPAPELIGVRASALAAPVPAAPAAPEVMDLAAAVRLALENDPLLPVLRAEVKALRAAQSAVGVWRDPELRATYNEGRTTEFGDLNDEVTDTNSGFQWDLRLFPPNPWEVRAGRAGAGAALQAALARLRAEETKVAAEARRLHLEARVADQRLALLEKAFAVERERRALYEQLKAQGEITLEDSLEAELKYVDANARQRQAAQERRLAIRALAGRLAVSHDLIRLPAAAAEPDLTEPPAAFNAETRGDLSALAWDRTQAAAALNEAKSLRIPWLAHLQAGYETENRRIDDYGWSVQAAIILPVFSLVGRDIDLRAAELRLAEERQVEARQRAEAVVAEALTSWREARAVYASACADMAPIQQTFQASLDLIARQAGVRPEMAIKFKSGLLKAETVLLEARAALEEARLRVDEALAGTAE